LSLARSCSESELIWPKVQQITYQTEALIPSDLMFMTKQPVSLCSLIPGLSVNRQISGGLINSDRLGFRLPFPAKTFSTQANLLLFLPAMF
jgi:hypothetical protein